MVGYVYFDRVEKIHDKQFYRTLINNFNNSNFGKNEEIFLIISRSNIGSFNDCW